MSGRKRGGKQGSAKGPTNLDEAKEQDGDTQELKPENFKFDFGSNAPKVDFGKGMPSIFDFGGKDAALLEMMQSRLGIMVGKSSGYLETLPENVQNRVKALKQIHESKTELEAQFRAELSDIEKKYESLYEPLYLKRADIVSGRVEPTPEERGDVVWEVKEGEKKDDTKKDEKKEGEKKEGEKDVEKKEEEKEGEKKEREQKPSDNIKGIPEFWLTILKHHDELAELISDGDEEALKFLVDIRNHMIDNGPSFVLEFEFAENPFFADKIISKTYHLIEDKKHGEISFDHTDSTQIMWKEGKNLTVKKVVQQQKGKGKSKGRRGRGGASPPVKTITIEETCRSFFNFFSPEKLVELRPEDEDEDEDEDPIEAMMETDYNLGMEFRERIIPNAVLFFTGEIEEFDVDGEEDDGDDDVGEDDDYDSENDEDFAPQTDAAPPAECKQQ